MFLMGVSSIVNFQTWTHLGYKCVTLCPGTGGHRMGPRGPHSRPLGVTGAAAAEALLLCPVVKHTPGP